MAAKPPRIVILAGGASSRLGEPKALVALPGGAPVLRLVAQALATTPAHPLLVVTGKHDVEIRAALAPLLRAQPAPGRADQAPVRVLTNPHWAAGRTTSIQCAAQAAPGEDLILLPVDHPRIRTELLQALAEAWRRAGEPPHGWLAPASTSNRQLASPPTAPPELSKSPPSHTAQLRPGHPICIGRGLIAQLVAPDTKTAWQTRSLRDLRAAADPLWCIPVPDPLDALAIHENLDTPADLALLRERDALPDI